MKSRYCIFLVEDEPLILMDLELAAHDRGCETVSAMGLEAALQKLEQKAERIEMAILDISLGGGTNSFPIAAELAKRGIPFIFHSGDREIHRARIQEMQTQLVSKPAPSDQVISHAIDRFHQHNDDPDGTRLEAAQ
jgi:DNA-binding NtrC family response regulator